MYIRNEIFDNTIKEELRRRREVKGEIDEPIKSDLIYKFDNNGDFLGMKRSHQKKIRRIKNRGKSYVSYSMVSRRERSRRSGYDY
jgi:hypothetical protein